MKKITFTGLVAGTAILAGLYQWTCNREAYREQADLSRTIQEAPRKEYVVREGDTLGSIRHEVFPLEEGEFIEVNRLHPAPIVGVGDYRTFVTSNLWSRVVVSENDIPFSFPYRWVDGVLELTSPYQLEDGRVIKVPSRN